MLSLKKVGKRFGGVVAVDGVDLDVAQGEVHALIGPNGAGKTTLISLISGTMPSDQGEIYFRNQELTRSKPHARVAAGLARSYQITSIFRRFSVLDNLALAVQARSGSSFSFWKPVAAESALFDEARTIAAEVGLGEKTGSVAAQLSHGEQRQLEIVLGLASDPKILLLDEPAAGLSSGESVEMTKFLMKLDPKLAILLIEHDMDVVFDLAHTISVLHFGEILETGAPEQIKNSQKVQEIYLGTG